MKIKKNLTVKEKQAVKEWKEIKKEWKKVNPPITPTLDFKEGMEIEGIYSGVKKDVGKNKSLIHEIEKSDGSLIAIWGSSHLDPQMEQVKIGNGVLIRFIRLVEMKGKRKPMKEFEVYTH